MTLQEKINSIIEKSEPISVKFFELINECNLTQNDAANVLGLPYRTMLTIRSNRRRTAPTPAPTPAPAPAPSYENDRLTFGVEIECFSNLTPQGLHEAFLRNNIFSQNDYEHYNHVDSRNNYKIMRDGSVYDNSGRYGHEVVSPVLNDFETLQNVCKVINENGGRVNKRCGLHVHIGCSDLNFFQYQSVFVNYARLELAIDKFMAKSRRENNAFYAKSVRYHLDFILSAFCHADLTRGEFSERYFKVNPHSFTRHSTIEFRQHQGTTDFKKIKMWVSFCKKLVEFSKTNRLENDITEISEIPFLSDTEKTYFARRAEQLA